MLRRFDHESGNPCIEAADCTGAITVTNPMVPERQLRRRKLTAWLNVPAALIWLSIPLRNLYLPGFLRVAHLSHPDQQSLGLLQMTSSIILAGRRVEGLFEYSPQSGT
jgi:hypothetical protein